MTQTQYQKGYLYKKNGGWHVRYREEVRQKDESIVVRHRSHKIADVRSFPRKVKVRALADEFMWKLNLSGFTPEVGVTVENFVERVYLPYVESDKRASTLKAYREIWRRHVCRRVGHLRVRDFRTVDGSRLLRTITVENDLTKTTLQHIKSNAKRGFHVRQE